MVRRIGEDTYRVKEVPGHFEERHESQLRAREPDIREKHASLHYTAHEAGSDDDYAEQDNYTVEKILAHPPNVLAPADVEFKVRWRGYRPLHDTWEPVSSFVLWFNTPFMEHLRRHKTQLHISDFEALSNAIEAFGD